MGLQPSGTDASRHWTEIFGYAPRTILLQINVRWNPCGSHLEGRFQMKRIVALVVVQCAALIMGCASLPSLEGRSETTALADTAGTRLGRAVAADVAANSGKTGCTRFRSPATPSLPVQ